MARAALKPRKPKTHAEYAVDQIVVERQKSAAEQTEMDETNGAGQDEAICDNLPPWPPGRGYGAAGQRRRPAAENDGDQQEDAE